MIVSVQVKNTRYPYKCKVRGLCITVLDCGVSFTEVKVHQASAENRFITHTHTHPNQSCNHLNVK